MEQKYISTPTPLLNKGKLDVAGYSTHMNFIYDKKAVKSNKLKEWDFYQIISGDTVIQMTVGHVSYCAQISAAMFNVKTGQRREVSKILLNSRKIKKRLSVNPEKPDLFQWFSKNLKVQFETSSSMRRLTMTESDKKGVRTDIDLILTNANFNKEKMVIATPFFKPNQWYLNCKENCFVVDGHCQIDDMYLEVVDGNGLLDWGRGVWPKKHEWWWGNGSTIVDGRHFGFNIGWGFGDLRNATENMFFVDNKAYKLGRIEVIPVGSTFRYADEEKKFIFNVTPVYDNATKTKFGTLVDNSCHQIFGIWQGHVNLSNGKKLEVPPFLAFCEHAVNSW